MVIGLFFFIIPIVTRVVKEKSIVMKGFAYITKKEILDILNWAKLFDVNNGHIKSFKVLAENAKLKVYELMKMEDNKDSKSGKHIKEEDKDQEQNKKDKLRSLVKSIFKFETKQKNEKDDNRFDNDFLEEKKQINDDIEFSMQNESLVSMEPIKPEIKLEINEEKIIRKQKKINLAKIDVSLRRKSLLKISITFVIFIAYLSLNLVFIITIHSYATKASSQYMNIKLRRPYTEAILMMSIETFYQNNTYYLISHPETQIKYLPEYVSNTLLIEEEILDFEKNGPRFIFSKYIHKIINYNSENFCDELETANESNSGCSTFDNGFFKNGLRASQFRAITNFQTLAKKFIKDEGKSDPLNLSYYRYSEEVANSSIISFIE